MAKLRDFAAREKREALAAAKDDLDARTASDKVPLALSDPTNLALTLEFAMKNLSEFMRKRNR